VLQGFADHVLGKIVSPRTLPRLVAERLPLCRSAGSVISDTSGSEILRDFLHGPGQAGRDFRRTRR
jgi:hypothetical protein